MAWRMRLSSGCGAVALGIAALLATSAAQAGGGYYKVCSSAGGDYSSDGETLKGERGRFKGASAPMKVAKRTVVRQIKGHCLSKGMVGQKFSFEGATTIETVNAVLNGEVVTVDLLCEEAGDGLPAAINCDQEVITERGGIHQK